MFLVLVTLTKQIIFTDASILIKTVLRNLTKIIKLYQFFKI